ncbi:hypothetical protein IV399_12275, partial [Enterococcus faecium]|nr:hypothetical protein [Enterococcus faecium]
KEMDFNQVNQGFISSVASKRNHIPRKSLNYQTPLEVFLSYVKCIMNHKEKLWTKNGMVGY